MYYWKKNPWNIDFFWTYYNFLTHDRVFWKHIWKNFVKLLYVVISRKIWYIGTMYTFFKRSSTTSGTATSGIFIYSKKLINVGRIRSLTFPTPSRIGRHVWWGTCTIWAGHGQKGAQGYGRGLGIALGQKTAHGSPRAWIIKHRLALPTIHSGIIIWCWSGRSSISASGFLSLTIWRPCPSVIPFWKVK